MIRGGMRGSNASAPISQRNVRQINQSWPRARSGKMISFNRTGQGSSVIISRRKRLDSSSRNKETKRKQKKKKKTQKHSNFTPNLETALGAATVIFSVFCVAAVSILDLLHRAYVPFFKTAARN